MKVDLNSPCSNAVLTIPVTLDTTPCVKVGNSLEESRKIAFAKGILTPSGEVAQEYRYFDKTRINKQIIAQNLKLILTKEFTINGVKSSLAKIWIKQRQMCQKTGNPIHLFRVAGSKVYELLGLENLETILSNPAIKAFFDEENLWERFSNCARDVDVLTETKKDEFVDICKLRKLLATILTGLDIADDELKTCQDALSPQGIVVTESYRDKHFTTFRYHNIDHSTGGFEDFSLFTRSGIQITVDPNSVDEACDNLIVDIEGEDDNFVEPAIHFALDIEDCYKPHKKNYLAAPNYISDQIRGRPCYKPHLYPIFISTTFRTCHIPEAKPFVNSKKIGKSLRNIIKGHNSSPDAFLQAGIAFEKLHQDIPQEWQKYLTSKFHTRFWQSLIQQDELNAEHLRKIILEAPHALPSILPLLHANEQKERIHEVIKEAYKALSKDKIADFIKRLLYYSASHPETKSYAFEALFAHPEIHAQLWLEIPNVLLELLKNAEIAPQYYGRYVNLLISPNAIPYIERTKESLSRIIIKIAETDESEIDPKDHANTIKQILQFAPDIFTYDLNKRLISRFFFDDAIVATLAERLITSESPSHIVVADLSTIISKLPFPFFALHKKLFFFLNQAREDANCDLRSFVSIIVSPASLSCCPSENYKSELYFLLNAISEDLIKIPEQSEYALRLKALLSCSTTLVNWNELLEESSWDEITYSSILQYYRTISLEHYLKEKNLDKALPLFQQLNSTTGDPDIFAKITQLFIKKLENDDISHLQEYFQLFSKRKSHSHKYLLPLRNYLNFRVKGINSDVISSESVTRQFPLLVACASALFAETQINKTQLKNDLKILLRLIQKSMASLYDPCKITSYNICIKTCTDIVEVLSQNGMDAVEVIWESLKLIDAFHFAVESNQYAAALIFLQNIFQKETNCETLLTDSLTKFIKNFNHSKKFPVLINLLLPKAHCELLTPTKWFSCLIELLNAGAKQSLILPVLFQFLLEQPGFIKDHLCVDNVHLIVRCDQNNNIPEELIYLFLRKLSLNSDEHEKTIQHLLQVLSQYHPSSKPIVESLSETWISALEDHQIIHVLYWIEILLNQDRKILALEWLEKAIKLFQTRRIKPDEKQTQQCVDILRLLIQERHESQAKLMLSIIKPVCTTKLQHIVDILENKLAVLSLENGKLPDFLARLPAMSHFPEHSTLVSVLLKSAPEICLTVLERNPTVFSANSWRMLWSKLIKEKKEVINRAYKLWKTTIMEGKIPNSSLLLTIFHTLYAGNRELVESFYPMIRDCEYSDEECISSEALTALSQYRLEYELQQNLTAERLAQIALEVTRRKLSVEHRHSILLHLITHSILQDRPDYVQSCLDSYFRNFVLLKPDEKRNFELHFQCMIEKCIPYVRGYGSENQEIEKPSKKTVELFINLLISIYAKLPKLSYEVLVAPCTWLIKTPSLKPLSTNVSFTLLQKAFEASNHTFLRSVYSQCPSEFYQLLSEKIHAGTDLRMLLDFLHIQKILLDKTYNSLYSNFYQIHLLSLQSSSITQADRLNELKLFFEKCTKFTSHQICLIEACKVFAYSSIHDTQFENYYELRNFLAQLFPHYKLTPAKQKQPTTLEEGYNHHFSWIGHFQVKPPNPQLFLSCVLAYLEVLTTECTKNHSPPKFHNALYIAIFSAFKDILQLISPKTSADTIAIIIVALENFIFFYNPPKDHAKYCFHLIKQYSSLSFMDSVQPVFHAYALFIDKLGLLFPNLPGKDQIQALKCLGLITCKNFPYACETFFEAFSHAADKTTLLSGPFYANYIELLEIPIESIKNLNSNREELCNKLKLLTAFVCNDIRKLKPIKENKQLEFTNAYRKQLDSLNAILCQFAKVNFQSFYNILYSINKLLDANARIKQRLFLSNDPATHNALRFELIGIATDYLCCLKACNSIINKPGDEDLWKLALKRTYYTFKESFIYPLIAEAPSQEQQREFCILLRLVYAFDFDDLGNAIIASIFKKCPQLFPKDVTLCDNLNNYALPAFRALTEVQECNILFVYAVKELEDALQTNPNDTLTISKYLKLIKVLVTIKKPLLTPSCQKILLEALSNLVKNEDISSTIGFLPYYIENALVYLIDPILADIVTVLGMFIADPHAQKTNDIFYCFQSIAKHNLFNIKHLDQNRFIVNKFLIGLLNYPTETSLYNTLRSYLHQHWKKNQFSEAFWIHPLLSLLEPKEKDEISNEGLQLALEENDCENAVIIATTMSDLSANKEMLVFFLEKLYLNIQPTFLLQAIRTIPALKESAIDLAYDSEIFRSKIYYYIVNLSQKHVEAHNHLLELIVLGVLKNLKREDTSTNNNEKALQLLASVSQKLPKEEFLTILRDVAKALDIISENGGNAQICTWFLAFGNGYLFNLLNAKTQRQFLKSLELYLGANSRDIELIHTRVSDVFLHSHNAMHEFIHTQINTIQFIRNMFERVSPRYAALWNHQYCKLHSAHSQYLTLENDTLQKLQMMIDVKEYNIAVKTLIMLYADVKIEKNHYQYYMRLIADLCFSERNFEEFLNCVYYAIKNIYSYEEYCKCLVNILDDKLSETHFKIILEIIQVQNIIDGRIWKKLIQKLPSATAESLGKMLVTVEKFEVEYDNFDKQPFRQECWLALSRRFVDISHSVTVPKIILSDNFILSVADGFSNQQEKNEFCYYIYSYLLDLPHCTFSFFTLLYNLRHQITDLNQIIDIADAKLIDRSFQKDLTFAFLAIKLLVDKFNHSSPFRFTLAALEKAFGLAKGIEMYNSLKDTEIEQNVRDIMDTVMGMQPIPELFDLIIMLIDMPVKSLHRHILQLYHHGLAVPSFTATTQKQSSAALINISKSFKRHNSEVLTLIQKLFKDPRFTYESLNHAAIEAIKVALTKAVKSKGNSNPCERFHNTLDSLKPLINNLHDPDQQESAKELIAYLVVFLDIYQDKAAAKKILNVLDEFFVPKNHIETKKPRKLNEKGLDNSLFCWTENRRLALKLHLIHELIIYEPSLQKSYAMFIDWAFEIVQEAILTHRSYWADIAPMVKVLLKEENCATFEDYKKHVNKFNNIFSNVAFNQFWNVQKCELVYWKIYTMSIRSTCVFPVGTNRIDLLTNILESICSKNDPWRYVQADKVMKHIIEYIKDLNLNERVSLSMTFTRFLCKLPPNAEGLSEFKAYIDRVFDMNNQYSHRVKIIANIANKFIQFAKARELFDNADNALDFIIHLSQFLNNKHSIEYFINNLKLYFELLRVCIPIATKSAISKQPNTIDTLVQFQSFITGRFSKSFVIPNSMIPECITLLDEWFNHLAFFSNSLAKKQFATFEISYIYLNNLKAWKKMRKFLQSKNNSIYDYLCPSSPSQQLLSESIPTSSGMNAPNVPPSSTPPATSNR